MPLVVPGINSNDTTESWMSKLMGKKLSDSHSETSFAKTDLPANHRVIGEHNMMTMDHNPDRYVARILLNFDGEMLTDVFFGGGRLNIHVDEDGIVKKVTHG